MMSKYLVMGNKRIVFLLSSLVVILTIIFLLIYEITFVSNNDKTPYFITLAAVGGYFIYSSVNVVRELNIYRMDKKKGLKEAVLEFVEIKASTNFDTRYPKYTAPIAVFRYTNNGEFISLGGNYSRVKLVKGKKYKVYFFRYSKYVVDIRDAYSMEK